MMVLAVMVLSMTACSKGEEEPQPVTDPSATVSDYSELTIKQLEVRTYENDGKAAYYLALAYDYGINDVQPNFGKAYEWYMKAVELGEARGNVGLGYLYLNGCGVEVDYDAAHDFFQTAIDEGLSDGYVGLARIALAQYEENVGAYALSTWDDMESARYLETHPIIKEDDESDKNKEETQQALLAQAENASNASIADTPEYVALAQKVQEANETYGADIYDNLKLAYDASNLDGIYYMGYIKERGIGCERDIDAAIKHYTAVAKNTSTDVWDQYAINSANTRLGILYMDEKWFAAEEEEAVAHFQSAADNGYAMAEYYVGILYQLGLGVDRDYETALSWFEKATEQDYAPAICQMGYIYFNGLGVDANLEQAAYYQKLAAAQGYTPAQINLGYMYENGYGVTQNLETALAYYKLAEESGYAGASEAIARVELLLKDM